MAHDADAIWLATSGGAFLGALLRHDQGWYAFVGGLVGFSSSLGVSYWVRHVLKK